MMRKTVPWRHGDMSSWNWRIMRIPQLVQDMIRYGNHKISQDMAILRGPMMIRHDHYIYIYTYYYIHVLNQALQVGAPTIFPPVDLSTSWDNPKVNGRHPWSTTLSTRANGQWSVSATRPTRAFGRPRRSRIRSSWILGVLQSWYVQHCHQTIPNHRDDG